MSGRFGGQLQGRAARVDQLGDELEQARVALEDMQEQNTALAGERDALATRLRAAEAALAAERSRGARREAAVEEMRRGFEAAMARLSTEGERETVAQEELRVTLEELRVTAEALTESNAGLLRLNQHLEDEVAARTAELEGAVAALRGREERLRLIFEGATDYAILSLDASGRVEEWNAGAERLLGFTADEVVGQQPRGMWVPEDLETGQPDLEMCQAVEHGRAEDHRWHQRKDGSRFWAVGVMTPLFAGERRLLGFLKILRDCTASREAEERQAVLQDELNHRVKNTLAVVQSVATQTLRSAGVPGEVQSALMSRLVALARSHDLLTRNSWEGASLHEVIGQTLAPHAAAAGEGRITTSGPAVRLPPSAVVTVNLAFHELATNAAKHGALTNTAGQVDVSWHIRKPAPGARPVVAIAWRERGGPRVQPPARRGFGSRLIEGGLAREFGTEVRLDFLPEGVECHICLPL